MQDEAVAAAQPTPRERWRTASPRRINHLLAALGGTRYLEVGVSKGNTFLAVDAATKVAVDPNFRFDTAAHAGPGTTFHEITSDAYFIGHAAGARFDVIFLDGLHVFGQTFRDFCNTMAVAHDRTVWLIDDTVPSDIYSAHPSQREAVRLRAAEGGKGAAWHGDVYKVVFAIADFFPTMSFATITTDGNPQTLVWRAPRGDFRPIFGSIEEIARLDYFRLQQHREAMNPMEEAAALAVVVDALKGRQAA